MLNRFVAVVTAASLAWCSLAGTSQVWAGRKADDLGPAVRTIAPAGDETWAVVDVRTVKGRLVEISPVVGREIDLEESNSLGLFQGRTTYNGGVDIDLLDESQVGFESAQFILRENKKPAARVRFRTGSGVLERIIPMENEDDLRRLREYVENIRAIREGSYEIGEKSRIGEEAEYPKVLDEEVSSEVRRQRFRLLRRAPGEVTLKDGEKVRGELVPVLEDGRILVQVGLDSRWLTVDEIKRLHISGDKSSTAMKTAVMSGVGGAAGGALTGAFTGWQVGGSVKSYAMVGAIFFGVAGFLTGLFSGAKGGVAAGVYVMGPVQNDKD